MSRPTAYSYPRSIRHYRHRHRRRTIILLLIAAGLAGLLYLALVEAVRLFLTLAWLAEAVGG